MVQHVSEVDFNEVVLNYNGVVLVDFWATWCAPCKMIAPILDDVAKEIPDVRVVKIDVDKEAKLADKYQITNIPTLIIFKNGEPVDTFMGFKTKDFIKSALANHM